MSNSFVIQKASEEDADEIIKVLKYGREVQVASGNLYQWDENFPNSELVLSDINSGCAYLCLDSESRSLAAVFSLFTEPDPNYQAIDGKWLNEAPYATIHRIASTGKFKGAGRFCIQWVQERFKNVRIDTHEDNQAMQYLLRQLNFTPVGTIYLENGDARDAFHYCQ